MNFCDGEQINSVGELGMGLAELTSFIKVDLSLRAAIETTAAEQAAAEQAATAMAVAAYAAGEQAVTDEATAERAVAERASAARLTGFAGVSLSLARCNRTFSRDELGHGLAKPSSLPEGLVLTRCKQTNSVDELGRGRAGLTTSPRWT